MLDSIDHMTLKILKSCIFGFKIPRFFSYFRQHFNGRHYFSRKSVNH